MKMPSYHIINRGKGRQQIFHDAEYYEAFLKDALSACKCYHIW